MTTLNVVDSLPVIWSYHPFVHGVQPHLHDHVTAPDRSRYIVDAVDEDTGFVTIIGGPGRRPVLDTLNCQQRYITDYVFEPCRCSGVCTFLQ